MFQLQLELAALALAFLLPQVAAHRSRHFVRQDFERLAGARPHHASGAPHLSAETSTGDGGSQAAFQLRAEESTGSQAELQLSAEENIGDGGSQVALQLGAEESTGDRGSRPSLKKRGGRSKRVASWVWLILPVSILAFLAISVAAMMESRAREEQAEERRRATQGRVHPLQLKWGAKVKRKEELHPESSLVQDLKLAFTVRRLVIFIICLALCFFIAEFVDERKFAVTVNVNSVATRQDCLWHCTHDNPKRALCSQLKFSNLLCPNDRAAGRCVPREEDQTPGFDYVRVPKCSYKLVPAGWKVDTVLCSVVMGIFLIVEGVTAEVILLGMACLFACVGIISPRQALAGLASPGVAGLAFLFPVAAAVEETGVLDVLVGLMLGNPSSLLVALFRMMVPVAFLSAFLSNTAIVTMLIPVVLSWARRLDASPSKLFMPLSFSAQLGGSCTLIGSSVVLVAKMSVDRSVYDMGFFDLSPAGSVVAFATFFYIALCLPLLPAGVAPAEAEKEPTSFSEGKPKTDNLYAVGFQVCKSSSQVGMEGELVKTQLARLPGVKGVEFDGEGLVEEGSVLMCSCTDIGLVALRRVPGLLIGNHTALGKMGMGYDRRHRHLYEVVVQQDSALVGEPMDADVMRQVLGACPVALRGKEPAPSQLPGRETTGAVPAGGDVLLLEADARFVGSTEWTQEFAITRKVENSSPQRVGGVHDRLRCTLVCLGMVMFCALNALDVVGVAMGAGIFTVLLVLSNSMTIEEAYSTIKAPVLLTIAGASALSSALQVSGIANFVAGSLTEAALPFGKIGIQVALYLLSAFLSMFMNNSATVAILGPMLGKMAADTGGMVTVKSMLFVCVFGAGTCLTTPLGYQTNMMVMKPGGYTFASFTKYGAPIQFLHMLTTIIVITLFGY